MSVQNTHPTYTTERENEWRLMRACDYGESEVKRKGETYLPKPSGFDAMNQPEVAYNKYKARANFPEILNASLGAMIGLVHGQEGKIQIEMPEAMNFLWEEATDDDTPMSLEAFHRKITRELLLCGRYGVLADAPMEGGNPYLCGFSTERIINWAKDLYVLDETGVEINEHFEWVHVNKHRVLRIEEGRYVSEVYLEGSLSDELTTTGLGGIPINEIPFVVANAQDLQPNIETPPLIGIARAAIGIYQLDADYRYQLFMSGQETLVAINGEAPDFVGAGVVHQMLGSEGITPDLKYVSPTCSGIEQHLIAMRDKREQAVMAGARLLEQSNSVEESGEARKLRFSSESASLLSVAVMSCQLLEKALKYVAQMLGQNPDHVTVTPPKQLLSRPLTGQEALALVNMWQSGAISYDTLYENLREGGIASSERDADEEFGLLDMQSDTVVQAPFNSRIAAE